MKTTNLKQELESNLKAPCTAEDVKNYLTKVSKERGYRIAEDGSEAIDMLTDMFGEDHLNKFGSHSNVIFRSAVDIGEDRFDVAIEEYYFDSGCSDYVYVIYI